MSDQGAHYGSAFEEGMFKELHQIGKPPKFLSGDRDEDGRSWIEQIDLVAQLRGLGDSAKIALAVLLCTGKALEKARTIARTGTCEKFLEKLMQELAPENRLKYWADKFLKLELCVDEALDAFLTRLLETADGCKAAQCEYWASMSQTEKDDFMDAARRLNLRMAEPTAFKYYRMVEAKIEFDSCTQAQALAQGLTDPGEAPSTAMPYYMRNDVGTLASRIDYNRIRDSDFLHMEVTQAFLLQVLKGALWNFPQLKRAGFLLKHTTINDAIKDLEDTRRHAIKTLAEDINDGPARAILSATRKNRTLEFCMTGGDRRFHRGNHPLSGRDFAQLPAPAGQGAKQALTNGNRTPRPHTPHPQSAMSRSSNTRSRRPPERLTYTNNVGQLVDELMAAQDEVNSLRETMRTNQGGAGRRTGGSGGNGGYLQNKSGGTSTTGGNKGSSKPAQYGCKACRMIFGDERKHYLSDCPHAGKYRDLIAQLQKGVVNNAEAKEDGDETVVVNNAEHDAKHVDSSATDSTKKIKFAKKKKVKGSNIRTVAAIPVTSSTTFSILEEEDDDPDDINFPPLSRNTDDDYHVHHLTASPVDLEFARQLNLQDDDQSVSTVDLEMDSLNFQEFEATLDVEAAEQREALYEQIVDAPAEEEREAAPINAIANYDHTRATATFKIPGMGLTRALCDTGAGLLMIQEQLVPSGAVTKKLPKPMFVAGFNGSPAERITTMVRLALETADGAAFKPRWYYVTKRLNYGIILSKEWLSLHECHWLMSSSQDQISLLSTNKGRVNLDAKEPDEQEPSVCMVRPREAIGRKKFLAQELDGEIVGRLVLRETVTVAARQGVEISPLVQFVPEEGAAGL
jgi:hypothetical protein